MKDAAREALLERFRRLARSYVPEWRFSEEEPDPGSVLALLGLGMLADSAGRYERVMKKHRIAYLNLFDRLKEEPVESARSFVRFSPVEGAPGPVYIPKGARLTAQTPRGPVPFETAAGFTATGTRLAAVYAAEGKSDRIVALWEGGDPESCRFTAFDLSGGNRAEHALLLGFDGLFDGLGALDLLLGVRAPVREKLGETLDALCGLRFAVAGEDGGWEPFDAVTREGDLLRLKKERFYPVKRELGGQMRDVVAVFSDKPAGLETCGAGLSFCAQNLPAGQVTCRGILQDPSHFLPFGKPMELYAECGIECGEALERRGARVELTFELSFELAEELLPEAEESEELKIIMKRPVSQPRPSVCEVRADYVLLEYLGSHGWKRLIPEEHAALLFNGSAEGTVTLSFICPEDMAGPPRGADDYRLRLRLLRADHLYQIPYRQLCPVVTGLRFSYRYESPRQPDWAETRNNFETLEVTGALREGRSVRPFYNREQPKPALYLGFEGSPAGTPASFYFQIENSADLPVDFTAEYLSPSGFLPLKVVDNTGGMLYSETVAAIIPPDISPAPLFGRTLYWLRLINHNRENPRYSLPLVTGIYPDLVQVENRSTRVEEFFAGEPDAPLRVSLSGRRLIWARVYVNEAGGAGGDNWVEWHKRRSADQAGRYCDIDLENGLIDFARNSFSGCRLREGAPAVRVEYQSYQGSLANVPAGAINALEESIRFVSAVGNPVPAYGGHDGYNEESSARMIQNLLRTRGRAVTGRDYRDLISQVSYGVRRIKALCDVNRAGERQEGVLTIALLIEEYARGGQLFCAVKDAVRKKLLECSPLLAQGRELVLCQPHFVRLSVRLWLECPQMERAYDLQQQAGAEIRTFLDPLEGGFGGDGWEIGELPDVRQLLAYLRLRLPEAAVSKLVMTARFGDREYEVGQEFYEEIKNPFVLAVNGDHLVYVELAPQGPPARDAGNEPFGGGKARDVTTSPTGRHEL